MKLPNWFKILWWLFLLVIVTCFVWQRYDSFVKGFVTVLDVFVFLIWIALLLIPLFKEVKFFGIELKQEIDSLKKEVREQIINLRSEIQTSISFQNRINFTQNENPEKGFSISILNGSVTLNKKFNPIQTKT